MDEAQYSRTVCNGEWCASTPRDTLGQFRQARWHRAAVLLNKTDNCVRRAFAQFASVHVDSAHACISGKRDETSLVLGDFAAAQVVLLFGQDNDRASFRRF